MGQGGAIGGGVAAATGASVAFFSSAGGATLLLGIFGAGGSTLAGKKMARRTHGLDVFAFKRLSADPKALHGDVSKAAAEAAQNEEGKKADSSSKGKSWFKKMVPNKIWGKDEKGSSSQDKPEQDKESSDDEATKAATSAAGMHVFIWYGMLDSVSVLKPGNVRVLHLQRYGSPFR